MEIFLDTNAAARWLSPTGGKPLSPRTLEKWRVQGRGPSFLKFGSRVLYSESDLERYVDSQKRRSTSQAD